MGKVVSNKSNIMAQAQFGHQSTQSYAKQIGSDDVYVYMGIEEYKVYHLKDNCPSDFLPRRIKTNRLFILGATSIRFA